MSAWMAFFKSKVEKLGVWPQKGAQGSQKETNGALGVPFGVQNVSLGSPWGDPGAPKWGPGVLLGSPWGPLGRPKGHFGGYVSPGWIFWVPFWTILAPFLIKIETFYCYFWGHVLGLFFVVSNAFLSYCVLIYADFGPILEQIPPKCKHL